MKPKAVLDAYGLEVRCKLLEIAAILDRHDRGKATHGNATDGDARLEQFRKSLAVLSEEGATPDRAERIALIFSDTSAD